MMKKAMSDGEVNDYVSKKMMDDLDGVEADVLFDEEAPQDAKPEGVKVEAGGYSVHVKPMNGEQVKDMPKVEDVPEEDDELGKLGL
jgi:hypothetical protein